MRGGREVERGELGGDRGMEEKEREKVEAKGKGREEERGRRKEGEREGVCVYMCSLGVTCYLHITLTL